jgi:tetratricopeptide (TPR) repeat protein
MKRVIALLAVFGIVAATTISASAGPIIHPIHPPIHFVPPHFFPVHKPIVVVGGPVVGPVVSPVVVAPVVTPVVAPDYMTFINQGDALNGQGSFDAAIASYSQAIALDPNRSLGYLRRAAVWTEEGKPNMALADNTQANAILQSLSQ